MPRSSSNWMPTCLIAGIVGLGGLLSGCGGNPNEAEYNRTTSPGTPAEPESVASRRERTKNVAKTPVKGAKAKRGTGGG